MNRLHPHDICEYGTVGPEDRYLTERICTDAGFIAAVQRASERYAERYGTHTEGEEIQREILDFSKYAALGAWFLSPMHERFEQGATIVDLGCGAGCWLLTMAEMYPNSKFIGVDIHAIFPEVVPKNVSFIQRNVLDGIPIKDGTVDFVYDSLLLLGLPLNTWPAVVAEVTRILKPGGYYELTQTNVMPRRRAGPTLNEMLEIIREIFDTHGICTRAADRLPEVFTINDQFETPEITFYNVPIGTWDGSWVARQYLEDAILSLRHMLGFRAQIDPEKFEEELGRVRSEYDEYQYLLEIGVAYAQKKLPRVNAVYAEVTTLRIDEKGATDTEKSRRI